MYVYVYVCIHTHTHTHTHIYIYMYIYTYIYIRLTRKSPDTRDAYLQVGFTPNFVTYCNIMHAYTCDDLLAKGGIV